jgi:hypothetical protein
MLKVHYSRRNDKKEGQAQRLPYIVMASIMMERDQAGTEAQIGIAVKD